MQGCSTIPFFTSTPSTPSTTSIFCRKRVRGWKEQVPSRPYLPLGNSLAAGKLDSSVSSDLIMCKGVFFLFFPLCNVVISVTSR